MRDTTRRILAMALFGFALALGATGAAAIARADVPALASDPGGSSGGGG